MQNIIYLDNSATTKPCKKAIDALYDSLNNNWGNPSATHAGGINALTQTIQSRAVIAASIHANAEEIFFTSGGSESNNLALIGAARALKRSGNRIITTAIEHPSVLKTLEFLETEGFEIIKLMPDTNGQITPQAFAEAVTPSTILVSVMMVNNEIGTIFNVEEIIKAVKSLNPKILVHIDAVQAFGKLPINVSKLNVDLLSASGHKVHAPKGIGFLYKKKNVKIHPIILGGGQESGLRSGTESTHLISSFAAAVSNFGDIKSTFTKIEKLNEFAKEKLLNTGLVQFNLPENALPYIINISVSGYKAEPLLNALSMRGIYVSKGSACAKGQRSYVLSACGFNNDRIDSALRISLCKETTTQELEDFVTALTDITKTLRRFK